MAEGDGSPGVAEGLPALPDPDAWSARWTVVLAVVSLVAWFLPVPTPRVAESVNSIAGYDWHLPWELTESRPLGVRLIQPLAALAALGLLRRFRGARRGGGLSFVAVVAFVASAYLPVKHPSPAGFAEGTSAWEFGRDLLRLVLLLGCLGVAVGNHLRKRAPGAGLPRGLSLAGGATILGAYAIPLDGGTLYQDLFDGEQLASGWPSALVHVLLLGYALLGVRQVFTDSGWGWRCTALSRLARVLLVVPPFASAASQVLVYRELPASFRPAGHILLLMQLKEWGQVVAIFAPLAVGLAAWLEARAGRLPIGDSAAPTGEAGLP